MCWWRALVPRVVTREWRVVCPDALATVTVAACPAAPCPGVGAAWLYTATTPGVWGSAVALTPSPASAAGDRAGAAVALGEGFVMVGAPGRASGAKARAGAVLAFQRTAGYVGVSACCGMCPPALLPIPSRTSTRLPHASGC